MIKILIFIKIITQKIRISSLKKKSIFIKKQNKTNFYSIKLIS